MAGVLMPLGTTPGAFLAWPPFIAHLVGSHCCKRYARGLAVLVPSAKFLLDVTAQWLATLPASGENTSGASIPLSKGVPAPPAGVGGSHDGRAAEDGPRSSHHEFGAARGAGSCRRCVMRERARQCRQDRRHIRTDIVRRRDVSGGKGVVRVPPDPRAILLLNRHSPARCAILSGVAGSGSGKRTPPRGTGRRRAANC